jgi:hypothetical protein
MWLGPGSVRVGQFVGRLGIVAMPAVAVGFGLAERVVRRHVARLEAIGWLQRTAALRGDGSLVWLTVAGIEGLGLQLAAVRAPAVFSATTLHSVQIAWAAASLERQGLQWLSARELTVERERWQVAVANERGGHSPRLPDLVLWPADSPLPVAIVLEPRQRNPRRQRAALEGWQAAITAGRYGQVRYQTGPVIARDLRRLAAQIGLGAPAFVTGDDMTTYELNASTAAAEDDTTPRAAVEKQPAPACAPPPPEVDRSPPAPQEVAETPERTAERQRLVNELLGIAEPQPRRGWRRRLA